MPESADPVENTEILDSHESVIVRDSWFKGWVEGNSLIPQIYNVFGFTTLAAVLKDPPEKWIEFGDSFLSDAQIVDVGRYMSHLHKAKGINVTDIHYAAQETPSNKVIGEWRLQHLWYGAKIGVYKALTDYMYGVKTGFYEYPKYLSPSAIASISTELDDFFNDPKYEDEIGKLKKIVEVTRNAMFSPRAKVLANVYRATYQAPAESGAIQVNDKVYDEIERMEKENPDKDVRDIAYKEFREEFKKVALEQAPEFRDHPWYINSAF